MQLTTRLKNIITGLVALVLVAAAVTVSVRWSSEGRAIQLDWREQGGPPVQPPERFGFGSKLVTRTMRTLGGSVEPEFRPDGLVCRLTFSAG